jgi:hypothetical protein
LEVVSSAESDVIDMRLVVTMGLLWAILKA